LELYAAVLEGNKGLVLVHYIGDEEPTASSETSPGVWWAHKTEGCLSG